MQLFEFYHDVDLELSWISEHVPGSGSAAYDKSLAGAISLMQKHKVCISVQDHSLFRQQPERFSGGRSWITIQRQLLKILSVNYIVQKLLQRQKSKNCVCVCQSKLKQDLIVVQELQVEMTTHQKHLNQVLEKGRSLATSNTSGEEEILHRCHCPQFRIF